MFNKVVILSLLSIICYVNCGQLEDMIEDEKQRIIDENKNIPTKVYRGRVLKLRPKLTEEETYEIDKLMAQSFRIGDPSRPLPESDSELDRQICRGRNEKSQKILDYYRKKYATRLTIRIAIRLAIIEKNKKDDYYCKNSKTRAYYINNAKLVNSRVNQSKQIRDKFVTILTSFSTGFGKSLSTILCIYREYVKQTLSVLPTTDSRNFVENMIESYYGLSLKYISSFLSKDSEKCDSKTHSLEDSSELTNNNYFAKSESIQKPFIESIFLSLNCNTNTIRC